MKKPITECVSCEYCSINGFCDNEFVNEQIAAWETALPNHIKSRMLKRFTPMSGFSCNQYKIAKNAYTRPMPILIPKQHHHKKKK